MREPGFGREALEPEVGQVEDAQVFLAEVRAGRIRAASDRAAAADQLRPASGVCRSALAWFRSESRSRSRVWK